MSYIKKHSLIFVAIMVLVVGMAIAGCGSSNSSSTTPSPIPTATTQPPASTEPETSPAPTSDPSITWASYNGNVMPNANTPAFQLSENNTIVESGVGSVSTTNIANGTMTFDTTTTAGNKADWRIMNFFNSTPSKLTLLFRAKANSLSYRAAEFDIQTGIGGADGARIKFILRGDSNRLQIENPQGSSPSSTTVTEKTTDTSVYHIYQITYEFTSTITATVNVYVDGVLNDTLKNVSITQTSTSNCFSIGDGGGSAYSCDIDWVAWTFDGAFTPAQVKGSLPSGLGVTTGY